MFLGLFSQLQAQSPAAKNALGHIFDPKACGCIAGETIDLEAFKTSLGAMNQVALGYIEQLQKSATSQAEVIKVFSDLKNKTSNKPDYFRNSFATKGETILNTQAGLSVKALQMACLLTEQFHLYYLNDPKNAPATERRRYEEALKKGQADPKALEDGPLDSSPDKDPEPSPKTEEAPKASPSETAIVEAPKSEGFGSFVSSLMIGLAIGAALGLFATLRGRKKSEEDSSEANKTKSQANKQEQSHQEQLNKLVQLELEEAKKEIQSLIVKNQALEIDIRVKSNLLAEMDSLQTEIQTLGLQLQEREETIKAQANLIAELKESWKHKNP